LSRCSVACLLIPHLPVRVERRRDPSLSSAPLIVGGRRWDEGAVLDCCPRASAAGVEPGMRLSQAETLCPEARFLPADQEAYDAVHQALIDSARRLTPTTETDELGLVYVDVSGLKRRFDDDAGTARWLMEEATSAAALDVQVGLGSGKFVTQQAARAAQPGEPAVVPPGEEKAYLSPLDIAVLPLDPEMERRLRLLGVRTLGSFARLPRTAVLRQFGSAAGALHDLACGQDARPVHADAPPLRLERSHRFVHPVSDRTPLLAHLKRMVDDAAAEIDRRGYQAEGLQLELEELEDGRHAVGKPVKPPSASADQLYRLGARMLGTLSVGAPVIGLTLIIYPLRPFHVGASQLTLFDAQAASPGAQPTFGRALRETLRRLWDRFGELSILVASLAVAPSPSPIQVTTDRGGLPRAVIWRERIWEVRTIYEHWRERRRWWARPIARDYFRLEITGGSTPAAQSPGRMKVVFRDREADQWYVERRYV